MKHIKWNERFRNIFYQMMTLKHEINTKNWLDILINVYHRTCMHARRSRKFVRGGGGRTLTSNFLVDKGR